MRVHRMPRGLLDMPLANSGIALFLISVCVGISIGCASAEQLGVRNVEQTTNSEQTTKSEQTPFTKFNPLKSIRQSRTKLIISPTTLPSATLSNSYSANLSVTGGVAPYQFLVTGGTVPPGLTLTAGGALSGIPTSAGSYSFSVNVTDLTKNVRGNATISVAIIANQVASVAIAISPNSLTTLSGAVQQFTASVSNTSNTAVVWSASSGIVSSGGLFTAPKVTSTTRVTVKATSVADTTKSAQATVTVDPPAPSAPVAVSITPSTATVASGGTKQFTAAVTNASNTAVSWSATIGSISSNGVFNAPSVTNSTNATVTATSVADSTKVAQASVTVTPPAPSNPPPTSNPPSGASSSGPDNTYCGAGDFANFGSNEAPATLPRSCINTAIANTPSPGNLILLPAGGDLQTALNNLACGDTLQLQAGATFTGVFNFPAKNCDNAHWITIRTSAPDSALPPEGTRITPCYAGLASLPGRPNFNCTSTSKVMATIMMSPVQGVGPVKFQQGANHYRLIGLEITRQVGTGIVYTLVSVANSGAADHIVFDRVWLHGTAQDETQRGILLGGMISFGVVDSFFTDFHCTAIVGACSDAQTLIGGLGSLSMSTYKIVNNFLEASGENILFGGGAATLTPTDIEVRRNHFFKPLTWKSGQPGFVGGSGGHPFIVKNHFELKNAQRVLLEGNIMEYSWGGFSQAGYSTVLSPKNQSALCAACQVTDVTVRYSRISHVSGGFDIANVLSDSGATALAGHSYSIHDVVVDDIEAGGYAGPGVFALVMMTGPVLHDVTINHVTAFPPNTLFYIGDTSGTAMSNFVFTNNLVISGRYPIWSTGGGTANCAYYDVPLTTVNACFSPVSFTANAIITGSSPSTWPAGNFFTSDVSTIQFANFNGGVAGDYTLLPASPYIRAGTDGRPLGADVAGIAAATDGVY